jgi:ATP-dependent helicase HrpA
MLRDKCIALVKGLPKQLRRHFVPVPDFVDKILLSTKAQDRPLTEVLAEQLHRLSGVKIADADWRQEVLDSWYLMNFVLQDEQGKTVAVSRSLEQLQIDFKQQISQGLKQSSNDELSRKNITEWDFNSLPEVISLKRGAMTIKAWPCLRDSGEAVDIELQDNPLVAENLTIQGQLRLALIKGRQQINYLNKHLLRGSDLALKAAAVGHRQALVDAIISASFQQSMFADGSAVRDQDEFERRYHEGLGEVVGMAQKMAEIVENCLPLLHQCRKQIRAMNLAAVYAKSDIEAQVSRLFMPAIISQISCEQIEQYPRYIRAIEVRLEKLPMQVSKDRQWLEEVQSFTERVSDYDCSLFSRALTMDLDSYQWALEEYRVSLFAQQLGTKMPISGKRLDKIWQQLHEKLRRF